LINRQPCLGLIRVKATYPTHISQDPHGLGKDIPIDFEDRDAAKGVLALYFFICVCECVLVRIESPR
jgi:hypothetical protein